MTQKDSKYAENLSGILTLNIALSPWMGIHSPQERRENYQTNVENTRNLAISTQDQLGDRCFSWIFEPASLCWRNGLACQFNRILVI